MCYAVAMDPLGGNLEMMQLTPRGVLTKVIL